MEEITINNGRKRTAKDMRSISDRTRSNGMQDQLWNNIKEQIFQAISQQANRGDYEIHFPPGHNIYQFHDWSNSPALTERVITELKSLDYQVIYSDKIGLYVNWEHAR